MTPLPALAVFIALWAVDISAQELVWKEFRSAVVGFSVQFPGTPEVVEVKDAVNKGVVHRRYTVGSAAAVST